MSYGSSTAGNNKNLRAPVFAISRLRVGRDGPGMTTLVTFMGCPLRCKYCLNDECHGTMRADDGAVTATRVMWLTPKQLYNKVKIDNIYFQATGGGVCFGGGEPTLYDDFIVEFRRICGERWKITIETALTCYYTPIHKLSSVVDHWIVDIKDMNDTIYHRYTGELSRIRQSLYSLRLAGCVENVTIRVPHIPGYNTDEDVQRSIEEVKKIGFTNIDEFNYIKRLTKKK
jgi:pyruvate formate lyase activating enzyme